MEVRHYVIGIVLYLGKAVVAHGELLFFVLLVGKRLYHAHARKRVLHARVDLAQLGAHIAKARAHALVPLV